MVANHVTQLDGNDSTEFKDGRKVGERMEAMIETLVKSGGAVKSKAHLCRQTSNHNSPRAAHRSVGRLINRGMVKIDSEHPVAHPRGKGAVVLTNKGYDYYHAKLKE